MKHIKIIIASLLVTFSIQTKAQVSDQSELFITLKANDSLLFDLGFNQCKTSHFENLIAEDFEFYHDKSGVMKSKDEFMDGINNNLCNSLNTTNSRRELVKGSLEIYPLYNNGKLYGAIQNGVHKFYQSTNGQPETIGSTAKFSHVWIKEGEHWKIKRVLSYNHI